MGQKPLKIEMKHTGDRQHKQIHSGPVGKGSEYDIELNTIG